MKWGDVVAVFVASARIHKRLIVSIQRQEQVQCALYVDPNGQCETDVDVGCSRGCQVKDNVGFGGAHYGV